VYALKASDRYFNRNKPPPHQSDSALQPVWTRLSLSAEYAVGPTIRNLHNTNSLNAMQSSLSLCLVFMSVCLTNHGQKTTGQKTTKLVFLWRNLNSPDHVLLFHCIRQRVEKWRCCCKITL